MTSRFELWNNLNRAMMPLAHWYALIDNQVILELQNKVIHEVLYNRYCPIKWAPVHEHCLENYCLTFSNTTLMFRMMATSVMRT